MKDMRVEGSYLRSFDRLGVEGKRDITQLPPSSAKETMTKLIKLRTDLDEII